MRQVHQGGGEEPAESLFLCPQPAAPSPGPLHMNAEVTSSSGEMGNRPRELPAPLRHKELQMEQGFHGLLDR